MAVRDHHWASISSNSSITHISCFLPYFTHLVCKCISCHFNEAIFILLCTSAWKLWLTISLTGTWCRVNLAGCEVFLSHFLLYMTLSPWTQKVLPAMNGCVFTKTSIECVFFFFFFNHLCVYGLFPSKELWDWSRKVNVRIVSFNSVEYNQYIGHF